MSIVYFVDISYKPIIFLVIFTFNPSMTPPPPFVLF